MRDSARSPTNNRQSPLNHQQTSTRLSPVNRCSPTRNTAIFFSQQQRKYSICLKENQTDQPKKFQLDPRSRRPWSCRPRPQKNPPKQFDSDFTLASNPDMPPKYGKISSTGLYIKYHPGSEISSLFTAARHYKRTNEYTTVGDSTTTHYDKAKEQCLTGYSTGTSGK